MVSWFVFPLVALAVVFSLTDAYPVPEPAVVMGPFGNPVMFMRDKRTPIGIYPQRAMMFTGYYRPIRRTNNGDQATAVFAQGNSVKAGTYLGGGYQPNYLKSGPEPVNEPENSNAEAESTPQLEENLSTEDQGHRNQVHDQGNQDQNLDQPQDHPNEDSYPETTIAPEESTSPHTETAVVSPRKPGTKKGRKSRPVEEEEEDEEYDDDDYYTGDIAPFVPSKGKRRHQYPGRNIFFPMMFGYPGGSSRSGSSGSSSGSVTAIANSYSTGKGGVANSVATAYGGSPQKKSRRPPTAEDQ